jgi:hypothetical protein
MANLYSACVIGVGELGQRIAGNLRILCSETLFQSEHYVSLFFILKNLPVNSLFFQLIFIFLYIS